MVNEENKQFDKEIKNASEDALQGKFLWLRKISRLACIFGISSIVLICLAYVFFSYDSISCFMILFVPLTAILGVILGLIVLFNANSLKGNKKHLITALTGIAFPVIGISSLIYFFIFPFYLEFEQRAELFFIATSAEFFNSKFDKYPPSDALDQVGKPYCGALKLCEAFLGKDLKGVNNDSVFQSDGLNANGTENLYPDLRHVSVCHLKDIFENVGYFDGSNYVFCDVYKKKRYSGKETGLPILYYKADTTKSSHDVNNPDNPDNIYNYKDNFDLLALGVPGKPGVKHPLYEDPSLFYILTQNTRAKTNEPFNKESYILLSAGRDGLYGTKDDIANFDYRWRKKK